MGQTDTAEFVLLDSDRRLPSGGPLNDEYYGPLWHICRAGDGSLSHHRSVVMVPDPGDGSAGPFAKSIVDLLNSAADVGR